jgi:broad specificity phosphatase PhoE
MNHHVDSSNARIQTVMWIRHAVAWHNVRDATGNRPNVCDPRYFDLPLILRGQQDALAVGVELRRYQQQHGRATLLVSSPLTRCLQTASLLFMPGESYEPPVRLVCREEVREACGVHYSDRRRTKSVLQV